MATRTDWHAETCGQYEFIGHDGNPRSAPCDCGWADFRAKIEMDAHLQGFDEGLQHAKRTYGPGHRAAVLRELREEVAGMDPTLYWDESPSAHLEFIRAAVFAAIDRRLGDD